MAHSESLQQAINAMVSMIAALTNIRLYSLNNAVVEKTIDHACSILQEILTKEASLSFSDSENSLLIFGQKVGEKESNIPQVTAFFKLISDFGIKTLSFNRGLKKSELATFLKIFSENPNNFESERKIGQVLSESHLPHISIDEKLPVSRGKDQQLQAEPDIQDIDLIQYFTGDSSGPVVARERLKQIAADTGRVSGAFSAGLEELLKKGRGISPKKLSKKFGHMLRALEHISEHADKGQILPNVAKSISGMDGNLLSTLLTDNLKEVMDICLFSPIIDLLDDEKFKRLAVKMRFIHARADSGKSTARMPDPDLFKEAFEQLMTSEKALSLQESIQKKYELERACKKDEVSRLKEGFGSIMKGEKYCFMDDQVMESIPDTVEKLYHRGKIRVSEQIIDRLCEGLEDDDPDIHNVSFKTLAIINEEVRSLTGQARIQFETYLEKNEISSAPEAQGSPSMVQDDCQEMESTLDLLEKKGMDRSVHKRACLSGPVSIQIVSGKDDPVGKPFKGKISNISAGGLSFYIKTSKPETARRLLGRIMYLQFSLAIAATGGQLQKRGTVVGVKQQLRNNYSVTVKFDDLIDEKIMAHLKSG